MSNPTFSIVAMVRETPEVLERFAVHHLRIGAERVRLFYDGERSEAYAPNLPGVELTICDNDFWNDQLGRAPLDLDEGLRTVFRIAHQTGESDWQFFCDADEYLCPSIPIQEVLERVPEDCVALRIQNLEAVWGPGDPIGEPFRCTYFRVPIGQWKDLALRFSLPRRRHALFQNGLVGHCSGKHFLRRDAIVDGFGSHCSNRDGYELGIWATDLDFDVEHIFIAHFDAISESRWIEKWRRRVSLERPSVEMGTQRRNQLQAVTDAYSAGRMTAIFRELYALSRYEVLVLRLVKGILRKRLFCVNGEND